METMVRLRGVVEEILAELVEAGYFKTKAEAIRAGILELGKEYHVLEELRNDLIYAREFDKRIKEGQIELGTEKELKQIIKQKKRG